MINLKNLTISPIRSKRMVVLNNTNFTFKSNEISIIFAKIGSGKTTLIKSIYGLLKPLSGECLIDGVNIKNIPYNSRYKTIGYVSQKYSFLESETVLSNIVLPLINTSLTKSELHEKCDLYLKTFGLLDYKYSCVAKLSDGQRQRIAIVRALIGNPKYLLLDEPTSNLDYNNKMLIMTLLKKLKKQVTIIIITHDFDMTSRITNNIYTIKNNILCPYEEKYLPSSNSNNFIKIEKIIDNGIIFHTDGSEKISDYIPQVIIVNNEMFIKNEKNNIKIISCDEYSTKLDSYKAISYEEISKYGNDIIDSYKNEINYHNSFSFLEHQYFFKQKKLLISNIITYSLVFILLFCCFLATNFTYNIKNNEYYFFPDDFIEIKYSNDMSLSEYESIINNESIDYYTFFNPHKKMGREFEGVFLLDTTYNSIDCYNRNHTFGYPINKSFLESNSIIIGKVPTSEKEIVIDSTVANQLLNDPFYSTFLDDYDDMLNLYIPITINHYTTNIKYKIVGVSQTELGCIYGYQEFVDNMFYNRKGIILFDSVKDNLELTNDITFLDSNEIILPYSEENLLYLNNENKLFFVYEFQEPFKVVALYYDNENLFNYLDFTIINEEAVSLMAFSDNQNIIASVADTKFLDDKDLEIIDIKHMNHMTYNLEHLNDFKVIRIFSLVAITILSIFLFNYTLSNVLVKSKELSIFHSYGYKFKNIVLLNIYPYIIQILISILLAIILFVSIFNKTKNILNMNIYFNIEYSHYIITIIIYVIALTLCRVLFILFALKNYNIND